MISSPMTGWLRRSSSHFSQIAFGGTASDGRPLSTLMAGASVAANRAGGGRFPLLKFPDLKSAREAQDAAAQAWLLMAARTQIADTGRAAPRFEAWPVLVRVASPQIARCHYCERMPDSLHRDPQDVRR